MNHGKNIVFKISILCFSLFSLYLTGIFFMFEEANAETNYIAVEQNSQQKDTFLKKLNLEIKDEKEIIGVYLCAK